MATYIDEADLASYLTTTIADGAAELTVELANGLVSEALGEADVETAFAPVPTRIRAITLEVAARHWRNPQGLSSEQAKIDDYDTTQRREGKALTAPGVYLTDDEAAELGGYLGVRRSRVGSIRLRVPDVS